MTFLRRIISKGGPPTESAWAEDAIQAAALALAEDANDRDFTVADLLAHNAPRDLTDRMTPEIEHAFRTEFEN